ncbi:MAG: hypothetical protein E2O65_02580 [Gammaproteobacteria bacterium]|nr:MAG: hypothetical protein E2O65_02580 [Gammaproteobacteria bacterium]
MLKRPPLLELELFRAARREALSFSFWTDGVVYSLLVGAIGLSSAVFAGIDAIAISMATVGTLLGLSLWAWGYVRRRDQHAAVIMKERASFLVQKRDQELVRLDAKLQAGGMIEASEQIRELRLGFDGFKGVLEKKLSSGELGYQKFRVVLEELFLSALDNLEHAVERLDAALAIGIDAVDEKLRRIEAQGDDPDSMEIVELRRARTRYEALTESARELFQQNQALLTTLQHACAKVTSLQAHRAKARGELDAVLAEVSSLTHRVSLAGT